MYVMEVVGIWSLSLSLYCVCKKIGRSSSRGWGWGVYDDGITTAIRPSLRAKGQYRMEEWAHFLELACWSCAHVLHLFATME